jgi:hypothetical protein
MQYFFAFRVFFIGLAVLMIEERAVDAQERARRILLLYPYDNVNPVTPTVGTAIEGFCRRTPLKVDIHLDFIDLARFPHEANQLGSARNGRQLLVSAGIITKYFSGRTSFS